MWSSFLPRPSENTKAAAKKSPRPSEFKRFSALSSSGNVAHKNEYDQCHEYKADFLKKDFLSFRSEVDWCWWASWTSNSLLRKPAKRLNFLPFAFLTDLSLRSVFHSLSHWKYRIAFLDSWSFEGRARYVGHSGSKKGPDLLPGP